MNFQELVVAVEHELPVITVILNNGYLGMVRQWQEMFFEREYAASVLGQKERPDTRRAPSEEYLPDFVKMAEAHGAIGMRVKEKADVIPALEQAIKARKPTVIECIVRGDENVYPMVPPGASLTEMIHSMA
jgi:acetolactate synthase-1/2/3 large subunit